MATKIAQSAKRKAQNLKNKRILITAGPTWVPIDNVRVISNIATGETGILLAKKLNDLGAKVTLLLGCVGACSLSRKIRLIRFKLFKELRDTIKKELNLRKYDMLVHAAAVSDFKPRRAFKGKLESGKIYSLKLLPLPKIIREMRRLAPQAKLIPFKLETETSDDTLVEKAKIFLSKLKGEFIVANRLSPYRAYLIDKKGNTIFTTKNKIDLVKELSRTINYALGTRH